MSVTRADLITRLRNPSKASAPGAKAVLLTGAACADMREAADEIERLRRLATEQGQEIAITRERDEAIIDLLGEARSGYVAGSSADEEWCKRRKELTPT